jgi:hypothetical protein
MKVKIGPYLDWVGPYQIASALLFFIPKTKDEYGMDREAEIVHNFGTWLAEDKNGKESWLAKFCSWVFSKRKRTVKIHIDKYDTWSMYSTLSLIIVPMLKQLQAEKHGYFFVDDEDVPEHLRSTNAPPLTEYEHFDKLAEARCDWAMQEMIWAMEQISTDKNTDQFYDNSAVSESDDLIESIRKMKVDRDGLFEYEKRIQHGCSMFGKYFQHLWD